ncbi:MAG: hypothetical protein H5T86_03500 [Armatimonadetes bacterium]|nr:hypothetical protein [Armatimonadota bacterium]
MKMRRFLSLPSLIVIVAAATTLPYPARSEDMGEAPGLIVFGRVFWPGVEWFPSGSVLAARDARFADVVQRVPISPEGRFVLSLEPGEYYLMAAVDLDSDGKLSSGDGIGFYGVGGADQAPKPLAVSAAAPMEDVVIRIVFQAGEGGKLRAAEVGASVGCGTVTGTIEPGEGVCFVVFWPTASRYVGFALPVEGTSISGRLQAGQYFVGVAGDPGSEGVVRTLNWAGEGDRPLIVTVHPRGTLTLARLVSESYLDPERAAAAGLPSALGLARVEPMPDQPELQAWRTLLFADPQLQRLVFTAWLWREVWIAAVPATYYLLCGADLNGDGVLGPGDLLATTGAGTERIGFISLQAGRRSSCSTQNLRRRAAPPHKKSLSTKNENP